MTGAPAPTAYAVAARNLATASENRIHSDDVARRFGFGGGLVPGVELFAYLTHPFVATAGEDFLRAGRLSARFRRPVYDGERVLVESSQDADGRYDVTLAGADGSVRARGTAWPRVAPTPLRRGYGRHPLPDPLHPTGGRLPVGPLGSVSEPVDAGAHDAYLDGIGETDPRYRERGIVHPGALLRAVNALLMRNVALGPWIHTASDCRFLGVAALPATLHCDGVVTDCFERNGHAYVRYDALVSCGGTPVVEVDHEAIYRLAGS